MSSVCRRCTEKSRLVNAVAKSWWECLTFCVGAVHECGINTRKMYYYLSVPTSPTYTQAHGHRHKNEKNFRILHILSTLPIHFCTLFIYFHRILLLFISLALPLLLPFAVVVIVVCSFPMPYCLHSIDIDRNYYYYYWYVDVLVHFKWIFMLWKW